MNQFEDKLFLPQFTQHFDFTDSDCIEQSDYQDQQCSSLNNIGTHQFKPSWKTITFEDIQNYNSFCPYCGKYVKIEFETFGCKIEGNDEVCLAHQLCIRKVQNQSIQFEYSKLPYNIAKGYLNTDKIISILGGKQYILLTSVQHSLSHYKYFKFEKKLVLDNGLILLNMQKDCNLDSSYDPNIIVIPTPNMKLNLNLRQIGSKIETENISFNIDLSQIFVGLETTSNRSVWTIDSEVSSQWIVKLELELIFNYKQKEEVINEMNFKYQHELFKNIPLIKINKILLESKIYQKKQEKFAIQNTKASSCFQDICSSHESQLMRSNQAMYNSFEPPFIEIRVCDPKIQKDSKKDLKFISKTLAGSKQLQKRIKEMESYEIDRLIEDTIPHAYELLTDQYANYMVQTLVSVANFQQRIRLFSAIIDIVPSIVNLKQGTFAFQQILEHMNTHQQFMLISQKMSQCLEEVATDPNGNHFLRKLIIKVPFYYNQIIIESMLSNFMSLVNNKNSVCVLKVILKELAKEISTEYDHIIHIKKNIFDMLAFHTQDIITNEFGNYFIQEAYQLFGDNQMKGVSEFIFHKFFSLAREKYSSSVICKCLNNFWHGMDYYQRLKHKLSPLEILEMFRNKQANKVLLEIIANTDYAFRSKISMAISTDLPSKHNSSRWISAMNNGTIKIQQNNQNFSLSVKDCSKYHNNSMVKKKYYNIQQK